MVPFVQGRYIAKSAIKFILLSICHVKIFFLKWQLITTGQSRVKWSGSNPQIFTLSENWLFRCSLRRYQWHVYECVNVDFIIGTLNRRSRIKIKKVEIEMGDFDWHHFVVRNKDATIRVRSVIEHDGRTFQWNFFVPWNKAWGEIRTSF